MAGGVLGRGGVLMREAGVLGGINAHLLVEEEDESPRGAPAAPRRSPTPSEATR